MRLPNLSFLARVGQVRAIQSRYEAPENRNPDHLAVRLLPGGKRLECAVRGRWFLNRLRAEPFYAYLLARTRYYDQVFLDAMDRGVDHILNLGCGGDTRAYRFESLLKERGIGVVEFDQAEAIASKQALARARLGGGAHVTYLPLDLNAPVSRELKSWMDAHAGGRWLVMLEGVSPYVEKTRFEAFLQDLAGRLGPQGVLAYDFKRPEVVQDFGRSERTVEPFRLPADRSQAIDFHARLGYRTLHFETSAALCFRLAGPLLAHGCPIFDEDCLIQLTPSS